MTDEFIVPIPKYSTEFPDYLVNFWQHCYSISRKNTWHVDTVMNYELRPLGGRFIRTKCHGCYLRWNNESAHTMFVLRWS